MTRAKKVSFVEIVLALVGIASLLAIQPSTQASPIIEENQTGTDGNESSESGSISGILPNRPPPLQQCGGTC